MKKRITQDDYIKANRKASREAEIEMYGHPICQIGRASCRERV